MRFALRGLAILLAAATITSVTVKDSAATPVCCVVPDNGAGTAAIPPLGCSYLGQMAMINGLPAGATIQINSDIKALAHGFAGPGGTLGGTRQEWGGQITMTMMGTGTLFGFNRVIVLPLPSPQQETHSAPRTPFAPVQSFNEDLYFLQGQVTGDPDFDLLRITAGSGFGQPSPGHTILGQTGGGWAVDSFFDIYYRIDFVGKPGSVLSGYSGSTTGTNRHLLCPGSVSVTESAWGALKSLYR